MRASGNFPVLHGRRITNSHEFQRACFAICADLATGRISLKEANALNREGRKILKMFQAVVRDKRAAS